MSTTQKKAKTNALKLYEAAGIIRNEHEKNNSTVYVRYNAVFLGKSCVCREYRSNS